MTENKQPNKPNPQQIEEKVKELQDQGVKDDEILQTMALMAERRGNSTLARKLANTARELLEDSQ
ncbi:MAG: hypothetical protein WA919_05410 [Coleofasciculaceae cyanobacterium]